MNIIYYLGCNWYGFGAVFFGGLSMCIHGTVAFTRYHIIVHSGNGKHISFNYFDVILAFCVSI